MRGMSGPESGEPAVVIPFDAIDAHARNGDTTWLVSYFKGVLEDTRAGLVTLARIVSGALRKEHVAIDPKEKATQRRVVDAATTAHDAAADRRPTAAR
ncbi:MAG: hypothetical protein KGI73_00755 [Patescibacteria group bacterium]|nr:hypothetical protein [Patescibacteria group bacterium]